MYHPIAIANYFLKKSFDTGEEITLMKIIKLVYISHGWYRGITGKDLIKESAQAWKYGPVIESVYHEFKSYGGRPITKLGSVLLPHEDRFQIITPTVDKEDIQEFLDKVWEIYHSFTAIELSSLTHQEGSPWDITYNKLGGRNSRSTIISNDLIEQHYRDKINESEEAA